MQDDIGLANKPLMTTVDLCEGIAYDHLHAGRVVSRNLESVISFSLLAGFCGGSIDITRKPKSWRPVAPETKQQKGPLCNGP